MIVSVVEKLSKTDPSKVQEVVASQIELLTIYHNAGIRFVFFLAAVGLMLQLADFQIRLDQTQRFLLAE